MRRTLVSPANDLRLDSRRPTLVANAVAGKFVGGSYSYEFELLTDGNARVGGTTLSQTTWEYPTDLERDTAYRWRVRARRGSAVGPWSATWRFITLLEKRTPDPARVHGCHCPTWPTSSTRSRNSIPTALAHSCQEHYGAAGWEFMDRVIDALRLEDTRWGYNWKRGNVGDPSLDVIVYNYSCRSRRGEPERLRRRHSARTLRPVAVASLDQHHRRGRLGRCLDQPGPLVRAQRNTAGCQESRTDSWHPGTWHVCHLACGTLVPLALWHSAARWPTPSTATFPTDRKPSPTSAGPGADAPSVRGSACSCARRSRRATCSRSALARDRWRWPPSKRAGDTAPSRPARS